MSAIIRENSCAPKGRSSLARCAVAGSANLTEHALTLNMELGPLPGDVWTHFQRLIEDQMLIKAE